MIGERALRQAQGERKRSALRDHELIPGSRLVVRKRCAHGSRWRLETFLAEIEAFLDDVEAARPVAGERVV